MSVTLNGVVLKLTLDGMIVSALRTRTAQPVMEQELLSPESDPDCGHRADRGVVLGLKMALSPAPVLKIYWMAGVDKF